MKNVKKLLKKAMVFTLAASMLVGTPLTASAAGIRGVYSVSDGENNDIHKEGDSSHTGTVTNTNTNTGVLRENETKIIGIALDQDYVKTEVGADPRPVLKATVMLDGAEENQKLINDINKLIRWESSDNKKVSIDVKASDRTVATLNPRQAANVGEEVVITASLTGKDYSFEYVDEKTGETKICKGSAIEVEPATVKVFVKEYANSLNFKQEKYDVLVKHTVDMNAELVKDPVTANDEITWSISKTSVATISNDGVVTVKKYDKKPENNTLTVTAVSELGKIATATLTVREGNPANKVEIYEKEKNELLKGTVKVDAGGDEPWTGMDVHAKMIAKDGTDNGITDDITWSIGKTKTEIIRLTNVDGTEATLEPVNVGTAKITATATSGKKATFSVKVSATLTGLIVDMDTVEGTAYTGQSFTLGVKREPEMNTDALTWSVWANKDCTQKTKDATINAKGVLKIKNTLQSGKIYVKVQSKKDKKIANIDEDNSLGKQEVEILLEQSSINGITIRDITNVKKPEDEAPLVTSVKLDSRLKLQTEGKNAKTNIRIPVNGVYQATVDLAEDDYSTEDSLDWTNSNSKVADMVLGEDGKVTIKPNAKGTTKITVSGIKVTKKDGDVAKAAKVVKAQFTVNVIQPTTSLKLNKTDIVLNQKENSKGTQNQSVSLKATMNPKGAADPVNWTVYKNGVKVAVNAVSATDDNLTNKTKPSGKNNVNYKVEMVQPKTGDVYTVTATSVTGVSATATIKVLQKTAGVEIHDKNGDKFSEDNGNKKVANTKYVEIGKSFEMYPEVKVGTDWITAGEKDTEVVTFTQSGAGKVNIIGNNVYGVKEGKVTITAKTASNKKTTLKVEVKAAKQ